MEGLPAQLTHSQAHPRMLPSLNENKKVGGVTPSSKTAEGWLRVMHERKALPTTWQKFIYDNRWS